VTQNAVVRVQLALLAGVTVCIRPLGPVSCTRSPSRNGPLGLCAHRAASARRAAA
jgi:hypothetical protein